MDSQLSIILKTYELYKHLTNINATMHKLHRYTVGEKTLNEILSLLDNLIRAKDVPAAHKLSYLVAANSNLEIIRFHLRLYLDLRLTNETRVFQLQATSRDIGRQLGGWIKSQK